MCVCVVGESEDGEKVLTLVKFYNIIDAYEYQCWYLATTWGTLGYLYGRPKRTERHSEGLKTINEQRDIVKSESVFPELCEAINLRL